MEETRVLTSPTVKEPESKNEVVVRRVLDLGNAAKATLPVSAKPVIAKELTVILHQDNRYLLFAEGLIGASGDNVPVDGFTETSVRNRIPLLLGTEQLVANEIWDEAKVIMENGGKARFSIVENRISLT